MTRVVYWEVNGKKKNRSTDICFARLGGYYGGTVSSKVIYAAPIQSVLRDDEVKQYIKFLYEMFGVPFTGGVFKHRLGHRKNRRIIWQLNSAGMGKYTALLYLTAFRYVDELAMFLKKFLPACKDKTIEEQFIIFQEMHVRAMKESDFCGYMPWGHTLMYGPNPPITLKEFHSNIANKVSSVYNHFKK